MSRVEVRLGSRSYDVLIARGLLGTSAGALGSLSREGRIFIVADETAWAFHGRSLLDGLGAAAAGVLPVAATEGLKSWEGLARVTDFLLAAGIERRDHVLAFGGGVIGDLAGFAAAIVKRGCGLIQVPTTLLAQVDSSVGGKTGINTGAGKNMIGAFHQPSLVLIDPDVLETLPDRHLRAGYAEVVKYGLIGDADFFRWCETHGASLLARDPAALHHAIECCIRSKAAIVASDEQDLTGRRALLNLGHTFGHAMEAATGYSGDLLHGEAVAIGIALAFRFSVVRGLCSERDAGRITRHLAGVGLPTETDLDPAKLIAHMRSDKKSQDGRIAFILARGVGKCCVQHGVMLEEVETFLRSDASRS